MVMSLPYRRITGTLTTLISVSLASLLLQCNEKVPAVSAMEIGFTEPSNEDRPLALWPWLNGYVDTIRLVYELEQMKEKGLRGAIIWDIGALADPQKSIPAGPEFLGEESLNYISIALNKSAELGLDLGMVASSSWNAGGKWITEEDASMELLMSKLTVKGPGNASVELPMPTSPLREVDNVELLAVLALPVRNAGPQKFSTDETLVLSDQVDELNLNWEVPFGEWEIQAYFMSNTGQPLVVPSPNSSGLVIDHLSERATQRHFDSLLTRINTISAEHHLKFLMLDSYEVWWMQDWSPKLVQEFEEKYEYDPVPHLPLLKGYSSSDTLYDQRFRNDYHRVVSDMMIENHFGQSVEIAEPLGIKMLTEAGHGGFPRVDPLKALGNSHIPMGEFWNRRRFWVTKEAASAAHIYGLERVAAESLTGWNHWQHGPSDFKQLIDIAFCQGLNQVVFHTFTHNPTAAGKPGYVYHAGEHINVNTSWWEMARPFMDYIARSSYLLRQGNFVADACLYYGDQAPNLVPPERIDPNIKPIYADGHCLHCGKPKPIESGDMTGYDFDYMNADIIVNQMKVEGGRLVLPSGQSYRVMQLPDREDINLEVLRRLEELVRDGGIILGPKPLRTTSLKNYPQSDAELKKIADILWGSGDETAGKYHEYGKGRVYEGMSLKEVLSDIQVLPDFLVDGDNPHIDYIHRRTEDEEIYFISNSSKSMESISANFRVSADYHPEIWDAESGIIQRDIQHKSNRRGVNLELVLEPLSSRFVIFRKESTTADESGRTRDLQFGSKGNEISTIDLSYDWTVSFDMQLGGPEVFSMGRLMDWTSSELKGVKYYSGKATYNRIFQVEAESLKQGIQSRLVFENIQETARIRINGREVGILWTQPFELDITDFLLEGQNEIEVDVINTWNNRIVGDLTEGEFHMKTNAIDKFKAGGPLLESGLIGKVEIKISK